VCLFQLEALLITLQDGSKLVRCGAALALHRIGVLGVAAGIVGLSRVQAAVQSVLLSHADRAGVTEPTMATGTPGDLRRDATLPFASPSHHSPSRSHPASTPSLLCVDAEPLAARVIAASTAVAAAAAASTPPATPGAVAAVIDSSRSDVVTWGTDPASVALKRLHDIHSRRVAWSTEGLLDVLAAGSVVVRSHPVDWAFVIMQASTVVVDDMNTDEQEVCVGPVCVPPLLHACRSLAWLHTLVARCALTPARASVAYVHCNSSRCVLWMWMWM
jgi:hypothetical protein